MENSGANIRTWLSVVAAVILSLVMFVAPSVSAQGPPEGDPPHGPPDCAGYPGGCGSTTTTTQRGRGPSCGISAESATVGSEVTTTVRNVPSGGTVRVILDGEEVARGTNTGVRSIRAMPAQASDVVMTFEVPDLPPGEYPIHAVGDTFTVTCGGGVLGIRGPASGATGGLAFTGASILGLIALALALLAVGYYLVRRSRQRRALRIS